MDALADILAPYSQLIGKVAGTITTLQFLSGVFLLNDVRKQKSSDKYPPEPFLGGILLSVLGLKLGTVMSDEATIKVNIIGCAINSIFTIVFFYYASNTRKSVIWIKIGKATLFTLVCLIYSNFEDPAKLEFRLGMLITGILIAMVGTPLLHLPKIIERKSTEGMPFPIIFAGNIVSLSWLLYSISIRNTVMIYQNLLLFVLSGIQLSMFVIFPGTADGPRIQQLAKQHSQKKHD